MPPLVLPAALIAVAILAALAALQLAVAFGAPLGHFVWGGKNRVLPPKLRIASAFSIVIYAAIALVLLDRAGAIDIFPGEQVEAVATWFIFGYFTLGILANGVSRSKPERYTMTPTCALLASCTLLIALS
ncbi:hypothetical protein ACPW96_05085 [Micromonospora sp. DT81.3]|uniref:hypothetical protein n=1 Tax=Micromonospora sp. DT81.3 TaxID=3416523 RepID=UPI003CEA1AA9